MNDNSITIKECIAISVDIRKSTTLHKELGIKKSTELIAEFIECCYVEMNKIKTFNRCIYAGDGIIGVAYTDDNAKAFAKVFDLAYKIKEIIIYYNTNKESKFIAGIGIAFGKTNKIAIDNLPKKFNNKLFMGDSISVAAKICKTMPFKYKNELEKSYIAFSKEFYKKLSKENQNKLIKTKKKCIEKSRKKDE